MRRVTRVPTAAADDPPPDPPDGDAFEVFGCAETIQVRRGHDARDRRRVNRHRGLSSPRWCCRRASRTCAALASETPSFWSGEPGASLPRIGISRSWWCRAARLYRELRGQFADMIKVMQQASDSAGFAAQTERIRVSLVNAHVALNRLREFQGREAVIGRLQREVARKRLLVDALLRSARWHADASRHARARA